MGFGYRKKSKRLDFFRHTFSMLCEKYEVNENDRKRMMVHSFKEDITNKVYGHRELEDLRKEIEKIEINL